MDNTENLRRGNVMLLRLFRKINKNKWMFLCLLIGVTLAIIMIVSIPIYMRGNLERTLQSDMEKFKKRNEAYPGIFSITSKERSSYFEKFKATSEELDRKINVPILSKKLIISLGNLDLSEDGKRLSGSANYKLETVNDLEKNITITKGRLYSNTLNSDKIYEVIVSNSTFNSLALVIDNVYCLDSVGKEEVIKVKVVGVYEPKDKTDNFWIEGNWKTDGKRFLMSYDSYTNSVMKSNKIPPDTATLDYALDYKKINIANYKKILDAINFFADSWPVNMDINIIAPFKNMLDSYCEKEKSIQNMLWVMEAPVFIILILYAAMVAKLIVEEEKNEISVLQSRGVSRRRILSNYFLEGIIASIIAIAVGPPLGMGLCKVLGVTSGFLDFRNRRPIFTSLILSDYKYALVGIGVFMVTIMVPVFFACSKSIIMRKGEITTRNKKAIWEKYYLDVLLFAMSIYGLRNYEFRQKLIGIAKVNAAELPVDPVIYIITTLFILGVGLLFLRIYPIIIKVIFNIGKKLWSPSLYASLVNVGRNHGKNQFIMIFIILTIAIGIFNIKCARTMNSDIENKTRYLAGTDVVMKAKWSAIKDSNSYINNQKPTFFQEPSYLNYSNLAGAKETTKVFRATNARFKFNSDVSHSNIYLMGIITNEFGKTAWFEPGLMKNHWYEYLNLMAKNPQAILVSKEFATDYKVKPGDRINVSWTIAQGNSEMGIYTDEPIDLIVYGIVDYWPTYNPNNDDTKHMIVANLQYLQAKLPMDQYEVWIKKDSGDSTKLLYTDIKNKKLNLEGFSDTDKTLTENLYNIGAQNINAVFNLCFISIIVVTALAFLIYWTLSIKSRVLQFGIFRSMGMSFKNIISMIFCDQILISVVSMVVGVLIGNLTCKIFLPLLSMLTDSKERIVPLKIISFQGDIIRFSTILASIFIIMLLILGVYVSKIKMDQAIKLGED
jgi:putative ABC transport system permease protein